MQATVVSYQDGFVQFQVGFDRYRMAPELTDGIYSLQPDDSVIASIRMKRGRRRHRRHLRQWDPVGKYQQWRRHGQGPPGKRGPDLI
jgi:hypothetical protein